MSIVINDKTKIVLEECAFNGVKRVADCVSEDMAKVFDVKNNVLSVKEYEAKDNTIFVATIGSSNKTDTLDVDDIRGKREVYKYTSIDGSLAIIGSDKRGTIYGLFHLSELLGVSCLVDWFRLNPAKKDSFLLTDEMMITSKEPSVKYRGFFINDEWPAFGNWCNKNFGGFNAKAYEQIFLLLLRMKGNYMWPAMWSAIFPNDGPGLLNEELADELGVVMGMSHHEPCLRQGEEYKYLRGKDSIYGDAWNFRTNEEGITRFWEDGLKRSGKFENVITVGMRGEADTAIMGKNATLKDNIDLLRDVLKTQNKLIRENVNEDLDSVPRMLALYKEVEPYFYGDDTTKGLMDSPELEGVTLMLCDDNYGNLRTVPTEQMRGHKGGYGMYYHFDYHGFPISFEWVNSSYLPKVWEQMTTAYEFGIRELWIVNVGDLFSMEYPLSYFLDLAYDYDKWGINNINSSVEYTKYMLNKCFGNRCKDTMIEDMDKLMMGYSRIAHKRRPEAMNCDVYDPCMYNESDDLLKEIDSLELLSDKIMENVDNDLKLPVFELMYYPARANLNVQKIMLLTGKNHMYSERGCNKATEMAIKVDECLKYDKALVDRLHTLEDGMWYGMGMSEHIGFIHWCEEECRYPVVYTHKKGNKQRIIVSIPGTNQYTEGGFWSGKELVMGCFLRPDVRTGFIELTCAGAGDKYSIVSSVDFLEVDTCEGFIDNYDSKLVEVTINRDKYISGSNPKLTVNTSAGSTVIQVLVSDKNIKEYSDKTYIWMGDDSDSSPYRYISMEADGYCELFENDGAEFKEIPRYGKTKSAMKAFPVDRVFELENAPKIKYRFEVKKDGQYVIETYMNPSNAPFRDGNLYYGVAINGEKYEKVNALPKGFLVGDNQPDWSKGVLDNIRKAKSVHTLHHGINTVEFAALSPGFVLEKVVIYEEGCKPEKSYLGPDETYRV